MSNPPFSPAALASALPVPIIGPWIARMGYVADIFANPCHPTPTIWFYAAGTASLRVIASIYKPFNLAETFHGLQGGFRRHGLKKLIAGGHSGRGLGYIQALEELAPLKDLIQKPGWNYVSLVGDLAVKAEWYLFVVDVTTDFFINWVSQAYQYQGCTPDNTGWAEGHTSNAIMFPWDTQLSFAWQASDNVSAAGPTVVMPAGDISIAGRLSWGQFETLQPTTEAWLVYNINGELTKYKQTVQWDPTTNTGYSTSVVRLKKEGTQQPNIVEINVYWNGGWMYVTDAMVQLSTTLDLKSMLGPDP